jgi:hypothetical protein
VECSLSVLISSIPGVLSFRAARVCSIVQLSLDGRDMGSDLSSWMDCALGLYQPYPYGLRQGVTEILWRTLIADNALQQHPVPAEFGLGFMYNYIGTSVYRSLGITSSEVGIGFVFKYTFMSVYRKLGLDTAEVAREEGKLVREVDALRAADPDSIFPPPQKIRELFHIIRDMDDRDRVLLEEIMGKMEALSSPLHTVVTLRRLARTDNHLLSMVPSSSEAGDAIWIIPGLSTPFVLRRMSNGAHEIIWGSICPWHNAGRSH